MSYPFPGSRAQMTSAAMMEEHQLRKSDQESVSTASKGLISLSLIQSLTALIVIGFGIYRLLMVCNNGNLATGAWVGCTVRNVKLGIYPVPRPSTLYFFSVHLMVSNMQFWAF